jgi:chromatin remodeling complex protein RSC6
VTFPAKGPVAGACGTEGGLPDFAPMASTKTSSKSVQKPVKKKSARKPNAAFLKPVQPDDLLAAVVGSKPLPRTDLTKKLWDYIKKNKLQDAKVRTQINADDKLKPVFNGKKAVSMFEMTKLVSGQLKA